MVIPLVVLVLLLIQILLLVPVLVLVMVPVQVLVPVGPTCSTAGTVTLVGHEYQVLVLVLVPGRHCYR